MRSDRRVLLVALLAIVIAVAGAYVVVTYSLPRVLVPAGTIIQGRAILYWVVPFNAPAAGRVVGAAEAVLDPVTATSPGGWGLGVAPGTMPEIPLMCPAQTERPQANETFNISLEPGSYTLFWGTCLTDLPVSITVTHAIEFVS